MMFLCLKVTDCTNHTLGGVSSLQYAMGFFHLENWLSETDLMQKS